MANHGYVKTKKPMSADKICNLLNDLNKTYFKNNLKFEYHIGNEQSYGPHVWHLKYESQGQEWGSRICWLNTKRSFEIRHGGGTNFIWWIDNVVCNAVALRFDGDISDDGCEGKWSPVDNYMPTYADYVKKYVIHSHPENRAMTASYYLEFCPPEFQVNQQELVDSIDTVNYGSWAG